MRFRGVLIPLVRLCQCSGVCPISVYGSQRNASSAPLNKKKRFATLTAFICIVQLLSCIHAFMHTEYFVNWSRSKIFIYTNLYLSVTIRVHAGVVLIESYVKRSIQLKLLEKFDEIEIIFKEKFKIKTNGDRLRRRFRQPIIGWAAKFLVLLSMVLVGVFMAHSYRLLIGIAMTLPPLYISTLFYVQLMVYLDVLKYNIETINDRLVKLGDSPRSHWTRLNRQPVPATEMMDVPQQLIYLRICYSKTWEASVLINRCARWSLLLGINNDFVSSIANCYWILYLLFELSFATSVSNLLLRAAWIGINVSHFLELSIICEQILEQVST